jgi:HTH-type transcriptional regulator/antitoxin HipB
MDIIVRSVKQAGAGLRRLRKHKGVTQQALGEAMGARQATISQMEAGEAATRLNTFLEAVGALDCEIIIRPRTKSSSAKIEDIF